jgi:serine/threonine protein kinase
MTIIGRDPDGLIDTCAGNARLKEVIKESTFAVVYGGEGASGAVAVKVLMPLITDPQAGPDFDQEASLLTRLRPATNVVDLHDRGDIPVDLTYPNGRVSRTLYPYMTLERASGDLEELLARRADVDWAERLNLYRHVVRGVHQMHHHEVAHRDMKSSNCLLFVDGTSTTAKIADLGRAKDLRIAARTPEHTYWSGRGDARFAAPEHLFGLGTGSPEEARLADLYGLGSLLFEIATGVGLTQMMFPDPIAVRNAAALTPPAHRAADYESRGPEFNAVLESLVPIFADELPPAIRHEAVRLLRQLCDAIPTNRTPKVAPGRRATNTVSLGWLLNRVTILIKAHANAQYQEAREAKRKAIRKAARS